MRALLIFTACFVIGATAALIVRAAWHHPYAAPPVVQAPPAALPALQPGVAPLPPPTPGVRSPESVPTIPAPGTGGPLPAVGQPASTTAPGGERRLAEPAPGAPQATSTSVAAAPATAPVNKICSVCGMDVDTRLGAVLSFQGSGIGVGCPPCIAKFKADPERYGPAALKNQKAP